MCEVRLFLSAAQALPTSHSLTKSAKNKPLTLRGGSFEAQIALDLGAVGNVTNSTDRLICTAPERRDND